MVGAAHCSVRDQRKAPLLRALASAFQTSGPQHLQLLSETLKKGHVCHQLRLSSESDQVPAACV